VIPKMRIMSATTPPATPTPIAVARLELEPPVPELLLLLSDPPGPTDVVTIAMKLDWEPLGRVVMPVEEVVMIVPVSLVLTLEGAVSVGAGADVELSRPPAAEESERLAELDPAAMLVGVLKTNLSVNLQSIARGTCTNRDSAAGVDSFVVDEDLGVLMGVVVDMGVVLVVDVSEVEHGAKRVKIGTCMTCCPVTVTGTTTSTVTVSPSIVDKETSASVPEARVLVTTDGSPIDKDWLVD
jgi:hypothetical protein